MTLDDMYSVAKSMPRINDHRGGYIYAIQFTDGTVKVGGTRFPKTRFQSLRAFAAQHGIGVHSAYLCPHEGNLHVTEREAVNAIAKSYGPAACGREWFAGIDLPTAAAVIADVVASEQAGKAAKAAA